MATPKRLARLATAPNVAKFWLIAYLLITGVGTPNPDGLDAATVDA